MINPVASAVHLQSDSEYFYLQNHSPVSMKDKNAHGDQYVVIQIQVPKNLTPAAKEKLQEYKKVSGF